MEQTLLCKSVLLAVPKTKQRLRMCIHFGTAWWVEAGSALRRLLGLKEREEIIL